MQWRAGKGIAIALAGCATSTIFFIDFCNLVYRCGCKSLWNGAAEACNIHSQGTHHCPWCSIGNSGALAVWLTVVGAQSFIAVRSQRLPMVPRVILTFAAFPVVGGVLAFAIGLSLNYWI